MIDHGRYIRWFQRGGALRERPHKTYNKRNISKSVAGHPRYITEHTQYVVNNESNLAVSAFPNNSRQQHGQCRNPHTPP